MTADVLRISCTLEDDSAIDFERLAMIFRVPTRIPGRSKQQAVLIGASLLALDAAMRRFTDEADTRYPSLEDVLAAAGCRKSDIDKLLIEAEPLVAGPIDAIKEAVEKQAASRS